MLLPWSIVTLLYCCCKNKTGTDGAIVSLYIFYIIVEDCLTIDLIYYARILDELKGVKLMFSCKLVCCLAVAVLLVSSLVNLGFCLVFLSIFTWYYVKIISYWYIHVYRQIWLCIWVPKQSKMLMILMSYFCCCCCAKVAMLGLLHLFFMLEIMPIVS